MLKYSGHKRVNPLLQTIQLVFTHFSMEYATECPSSAFPESQLAVYSHPDNYPIFLDASKSTINAEFLLHTANFFKYHMTRVDECTLYIPFVRLEWVEKPRGWQSSLGQGMMKLGKSWKGSYGKLLYDDS